MDITRSNDNYTIMRYILTYLLLFFAAPATANITYVNGTGKVGTTGTSVTTDAMSTLGANLIVVVVYDFQGAAAGSLTDNQGNTIPLDTSINDGSIARIRIYSLITFTTNASHIFYYSSAGTTAPVITATAFSGVLAKTGRSGLRSTVATTTGQPGTVTPDSSGSLLVWGANGRGNNGSPNATTLSSPFTTVFSSGFVTNRSFSGAVGYSIQSTIAASNPTATYGGSFTSVQVQFSWSPISYTPPNSSKGFFNWLN